MVIVGFSSQAGPVRKLFSLSEDGRTVQKASDNINTYWVPRQNVIIAKVSKPISDLADMTKGNQPTDDGNLLMTSEEVAKFNLPLISQADLSAVLWFGRVHSWFITVLPLD